MIIALPGDPSQQALYQNLYRRTWNQLTNTAGPWGLIYATDTAQNGAGGTDFSWAPGTNSQIAFKFVAGASALTVTAVMLQLKTVGSVTGGTITVSIQADSSGVPSGTNLATSAGIGVGALSSAYANQAFGFNPSETLTAGSAYWIVLAISGFAGTGSLSVNTLAGQTGMSAVYTSAWAASGNVEAVYSVTSALAWTDVAATAGSAPTSGTAAANYGATVLSFPRVPEGVTTITLYRSTGGGAAGSANHQLAVFTRPAGTTAWSLTSGHGSVVSPASITTLVQPITQLAGAANTQTTASSASATGSPPVATIVFSAPHPYAIGQTITTTGFSDTHYNTTTTILSTGFSPTQIECVVAAGAGPTSAGGKVTSSASILALVSAAAIYPNQTLVVGGSQPETMTVAGTYSGSQPAVGANGVTMTSSVAHPHSQGDPVYALAIIDATPDATIAGSQGPPTTSTARGGLVLGSIGGGNQVTGIPVVGATDAIIGYVPLATGGSVLSGYVLLLPTTTKTVNYTASVTDTVIIVNAANTTVTLPAGGTAGAGHLYIVVNGANGSGTAVQAASGTLINGSSSAYTAGLGAAYGSARFVCDGMNYIAV